MNLPAFKLPRAMKPETFSYRDWWWKVAQEQFGPLTTLHDAHQSGVIRQANDGFELSWDIQELELILKPRTEAAALWAMVNLPPEGQLVEEPNDG